VATLPTNAAPYKRGRAYASLATLTGQTPSTTGAYGSEATGQIVINFPCMPETIELARSSTYITPQTIVQPDGQHIYMYTEPLRIPVRFSLSAMDDDYCRTDGPYALLALAARLHSLVMPIASQGNQAQGNSGQAPTPPPTLNEIAAQQSAANAVAGLTSGDAQTATVNGLYFPPACVLALVLASGMPNGRPSLGIVCTGFVEKVAVTLHGPWLQGSFSGANGIRNMPSLAEYEFTFVNQPGYSNNLAQNAGASAKVISTTAQDIFSSLYNDIGPGNSNTLVSQADIYGRVTTPTGTGPGQ